MTPCTTFVGRNPFLPAEPKPQAKTMPAKAIPAKKAPKRASKDEDCSTPYKPPMPPVVVLDHAGRKIDKANPPPLPAYLLDMGISFTDDPLPSGRCIPASSRKYDPLFVNLQYGKPIRVKTEHVGKIAGALRKYLEVNKKPGIVRTVNVYPGDTMGRVWLLEKAA